MENLDDEWVKNILNADDISNEILDENTVVNDAVFNNDVVVVNDAVFNNDVVVNDNDNDKEEDEEEDDDDDDEEDEDEEDDDENEKWIEKYYPASINIFFIYISKEHLIKKIISEKIDLNENGLLKKELLLYLIQNKKKKNYKLNEILLYQNNIENIDNNFDNKLNDGNFLKILPIIDNINFNEQILLFHSLNSIYILLNETDEVEIVNGRKTFKRIPYKKYTRKIKYINDLNVSNYSDKKTRKKVSFAV